MTLILIGISSWADSTLIESGFYPKEVKTPTEKLRYYSERFPVAEIDSSYHYLPTRRQLDLWLGNAPEGFIFDLKAFSWRHTRWRWSSISMPGSMMPTGIRLCSSSMPPVAEVTAPLGFVRFHRRNQAVWKQKDAGANEIFRYLYQENELEEWLPKVRDMARKADEIHLIFKNKYSDYPVKNAQQFARLLGSKTNALHL